MKISEIITESSEQILVEASTVLRDLPGTPIDFKILNPENAGTKKINPLVPKYLYFDYKNNNWYERKQTGLGRLAQKYLNPFADNTYMVGPERSPEDASGGSAAEEPSWLRPPAAPGLGRKLDASIPADKALIDALVHKYGQDPYAAADKDTSQYGSDNNRYEYDQDSNLWVDEETQENAPRKMQIELFAKYGRDRRGYPLNNAVDPRDTKEQREQKFRNKRKEFSRQELVIWRKYSDKIKSYADLAERGRQYAIALKTIAQKRQENINIDPLATMFDPAYLGLTDTDSTKRYEIAFSKKPGTVIVPKAQLTPAQITDAQTRMTEVFNNAVNLSNSATYSGPDKPSDQDIEEVSNQIAGYANDINLLLTNNAYDPVKIKTDLGTPFVAATLALANRLKDITTGTTPPFSAELPKIRGVADALSSTALVLAKLDPGSYATIKSSILAPITAHINTPTFKPTFRDEYVKLTNIIKKYDNPTA